MNRINKINEIRKKLRTGKVSLGSWLQLSNSNVAEIMGDSGYDWVAIDMEHGQISIKDLPNLCRAIELNNTLPLVRLSESTPSNCKRALDSGAGGVIAPMIKSADQMREIIDACKWPPSGNRGVGFSRSNLYGRYFESYKNEAKKPLIIGMIEDIRAAKEIENIISIPDLDAIFIGPYDLSASMKIVGEFENNKFIKIIENIESICVDRNFPLGIHQVTPSEKDLHNLIDRQYKFIAYSIDTVFLEKSVICPKFN